MRRRTLRKLMARWNTANSMQLPMRRLSRIGLSSFCTCGVIGRRKRWVVAPMTLRRYLIGRIDSMINFKKLHTKSRLLLVFSSPKVPKNSQNFKQFHPVMGQRQSKFSENFKIALWNCQIKTSQNKIDSNFKFVWNLDFNWYDGSEQFLVYTQGTRVTPRHHHPRLSGSGKSVWHSPE